MESVSSVKSKSRKKSSKKITEKNRLRKRIKNCLRKAEDYYKLHKSLNLYGKMKKDVKT